MAAYLTLISNICITKQTYYQYTQSWNFTHHKSDKKSQHSTHTLPSLKKKETNYIQSLNTPTYYARRTRHGTHAHTIEVTTCLSPEKINRLIQATVPLVNTSEASTTKAYASHLSSTQINDSHKLSPICPLCNRQKIPGKTVCQLLGQWWTPS